MRQGIGYCYKGSSYTGRKQQQHAPLLMLLACIIIMHTDAQSVRDRIILDEVGSLYPTCMHLYGLACTCALVDANISIAFRTSCAWPPHALMEVCCACYVQGAVLTYTLWKCTCTVVPTLSASRVYDYRHTGGRTTG
jgi:hypothetical protein